jgi:hypothetical protein
MQKRLFFTLMSWIFLNYYIFVNKQRGERIPTINLAAIAVSLAIASILLEYIARLCHRPVSNFFRSTRNRAMLYKTSMVTYLRGSFPFSELPLETQNYVIDYLDKETRKNLRLTSRHFATVVNSWNRIYNSSDFRRRNLVGIVYSLENDNVSSYLRKVMMNKLTLFFPDDWEGISKKLKESIFRLIRGYLHGSHLVSSYDVFSCLLYLTIASIKDDNLNEKILSLLFKALYVVVDSQNEPSTIFLRRLIDFAREMNITFYRGQTNNINQQTLINNSMHELAEFICKKYHFNPEVVLMPADRKLLFGFTSEERSLAYSK